MRTKDILTIAVLTVSLGINAIYLNEKLATNLYQKGITVGLKQFGDKLVNEVQAKGRLTVKMPDGRLVTLSVPAVAPKAQAAEKPATPEVKSQ